MNKTPDAKQIGNEMIKIRTESKGFEPLRPRLAAYTISNRAPSARLGQLSMKLHRQGSNLRPIG